MDRSTTSLNSMDDLSTIETVDADTTASSSSFVTEQLQKQVLVLTEQLNGTKAAERRASNERDKYMQMYNRTNERFLTFERKQLDQMRRILAMLTPNQHRSLMIHQDDYQRPRRAFTSPSTSMLLPSVLDQASTEANAVVDSHKTENDWNELLTQMSEIMDFTEHFSTTYNQQSAENMKLRLLNNQKQDENVQLLFDLSVAKAEYEKEQQMRTQYENQLNETNKSIEQERAKRLQKLRNYALLADDEGDILLSSLMKKAEKNDVDFREIKLQYENVFAEQMNQLKKLVKEREISHVYIQRLEAENRLLASRTNEDETVQLLTESAQSPQSYEEARNLIARLRAQLIEQVKLHDQLRNDLQQLQQCHKIDMREREQIEESLNGDLTAARDELVVLRSIRSEYDRILSFKKQLELQLEDCANELLMSKASTSPLVNQLKEKLEQISAEKDKVSEDNAGLRVQMHKLKVDFENSESVQHDFVKLSQSLQMQLEELRNSGNELRWQPEDDFSECQRCRQPFTVTWRKHHCRHCGKVLCKDCTTKTVYTGPNNRPSRVCDICYTLLDKTAQPYFLTSPPKY